MQIHHQHCRRVLVVLVAALGALQSALPLVVVLAVVVAVVIVAPAHTAAADSTVVVGE